MRVRNPDWNATLVNNRLRGRQILFFNPYESQPRFPRLNACGMVFVTVRYR